jgi:hypothetical protein
MPGTIAILPDDKTPWLSIRQFQVKYGVAESTVRMYIAHKTVTAILLEGVTSWSKASYRIKDPEWVTAGPLEKLDDSISMDDLIVLRPCEVAELLGVSTKWIQIMARRGQLKHFTIGKGKTFAARRYSLSAVRQFIAMRANGGNKQKRGAVRKAMVDLARARLQAAL